MLLPFKFKRLRYKMLSFKSSINFSIAHLLRGNKKWYSNDTKQPSSAKCERCFVFYVLGKKMSNLYSNIYQNLPVKDLVRMQVLCHFIKRTQVYSIQNIQGFTNSSLCEDVQISYSCRNVAWQFSKRSYTLQTLSWCVVLGELWLTHLGELSSIVLHEIAMRQKFS